MYLQFVQKVISNAHLMLVHNKHLQTNKFYILKLIVRDLIL
ncbi:unknown [Bacteroides intestinalis CAG:315]|nr:unknown [Bacteroides intestinalis CAG:315]